MRDILFRGFCENKNGKEKAFYKEEWHKGEWVKGYLYPTLFSLLPRKPFICFPDYPYWGIVEVASETVGQCTKIADSNENIIFEGDIVDFFGHEGKVVFDYGAFGIYIPEGIDYDFLLKAREMMGCKNLSNFCSNENFISFWELLWNYDELYNDEVGYCGTVDVIGNIYSNPEILR